jgi:excisionase family DNA binding protein
MEKFNVAEAAEFIGISKSSLYTLIKNKKIEHYKIEGKILLDKETLENYVNSSIVKEDRK